MPPQWVARRAAAPPLRSPREHRPAVSGMIETLILIGISVTAVAVLAVAFDVQGGGWRTWDRAHCTLYVEGREDIGGGVDYVNVTVRNTGDVIIDSFVVQVGDSYVVDSSAPPPVPSLQPGDTYVDVNTPPADPAGTLRGYAEAVVEYEGGITGVCERVRGIAWSGGGAGGP